MRSETEIRELKEKLDKLTGFISDFGSENEQETADLTYACNASDSLSWVLGEIQDFEDEEYLDMAKLQQAAKGIEKRTGKKLQNYQ